MTALLTRRRGPLARPEYADVGQKTQRRRRTSSSIFPGAPILSPPGPRASYGRLIILVICSLPSLGFAGHVWALSLFLSVCPWKTANGGHRGGYHRTRHHRRGPSILADVPRARGGIRLPFSALPLTCPDTRGPRYLRNGKAARCAYAVFFIYLPPLERCREGNTSS